MKTFSKILSLLLLMGLHGYSSAYTSVMDNGEIMSAGEFKMTGESQFITSEHGGMNLSGRFDGGINEEMGYRGQFGFGKTDVFMGGLVKYMPFPDTDTQPAIGFNAGLLYARNSGNSVTTVRFEPLASKQFDVTFGKVTPYTSLPLGLRTGERDINGDNKSSLQMQFALGSQIKVQQWKNLQFLGEVGLNLKDAPSYISIGAVLYFDPNKGLVL